MVRKTDIKKAGSASFDSDPAGTLISELNQILGVLVFWGFSVLEELRFGITNIQAKHP